MCGLWDAWPLVGPQWKDLSQGEYGCAGPDSSGPSCIERAPEDTDATTDEPPRDGRAMFVTFAIAFASPSTFTEDVGPKGKAAQAVEYILLVPPNECVPHRLVPGAQDMTYGYGLSRIYRLSYGTQNTSD